MSHFEALFSSRIFFEFSTVAYFIVIWQLMSNYRLIRLKRFFSSFTVKLCNELFFQLHLMLHVYVQRFDMMIIGTLAIFFVFESRSWCWLLCIREEQTPLQKTKKEKRERNKLRRRCNKPASHPLPVEIRSPLFPFFELDSIGSRVLGKEPSTLTCSASDSKPYFPW